MAEALILHVMQVPDDSKLVQSILAFFMEPLNRTPSKNTVSSERKRVHSETTRQKLVCAGHLSQLESSGKKTNYS